MYIQEAAELMDGVDIHMHVFHPKASIFFICNHHRRIPGSYLYLSVRGSSVCASVCVREKSFSLRML